MALVGDHHDWARPWEYLFEQPDNAGLFAACCRLSGLSVEPTVEVGLTNPAFDKAPRGSGQHLPRAIDLAQHALGFRRHSPLLP